MSEPFLGEIRILSFNYPPTGWAFCNGQLLPINQNQALFSILGTTYGGDGRQTFALPDLQGRMPFHTGNSISLGQKAGEAAHTLSAAEMPTHPHGANGTAATPDQPGPGGNLWASNASTYSTGVPTTTMDPSTSVQAGGSQPHDNMPPYLVLNFAIALQGIFPSRS